MIIQLTKGKQTIVDCEDYFSLNQYKWHAAKDKKYNIYYAIRSFRVNGILRSEIMHRVIMGCEKPLVVDHINHNTLDNRKENLRICTVSQNSSNVTNHKDSYSKYLGVTYSKRDGYYYVCLTKYNKQYRKYGFKTEIEAALGYNKLALLHHGEFANLNKF